MTLDPEDNLVSSPGRDPSDAARLVFDDATPPEPPRRSVWPWVVMALTAAGMLVWGAWEAMS